MQWRDSGIFMLILLLTQLVHRYHSIETTTSTIGAQVSFHWNLLTIYECYFLEKYPVTLPIILLVAVTRWVLIAKTFSVKRLCIPFAASRWCASCRWWKWRPLSAAFWAIAGEIVLDVTNEEEDASRSLLSMANDTTSWAERAVTLNLRMSTFRWTSRRWRACTSSWAGHYVQEKLDQTQTGREQEENSSLYQVARFWAAAVCRWSRWPPCKSAPTSRVVRERWLWCADRRRSSYRQPVWLAVLSFPSMQGSFLDHTSAMTFSQLFHKPWVASFHPQSLQISRWPLMQQLK